MREYLLKRQDLTGRAFSQTHQLRIARVVNVSKVRSSTWGLRGGAQATFLEVEAPEQLRYIIRFGPEFGQL